MGYLRNEQLFIKKRDQKFTFSKKGPIFKQAEVEAEM
jgi:hypothetical protein